jgi:hypothetical protein
MERGDEKDTTLLLTPPASPTCSEASENGATSSVAPTEHPEAPFQIQINKELEVS